MFPRSLQTDLLGGLPLPGAAILLLLHLAGTATALVLVEGGAGEAADAPLGEQFGAHALVEVDGVLVPVEHASLHPPHPDLRRPARDGREHHPAEPVAAPGRAHEDVLHVQPELGEEGAVVGEADDEPGRDAPAAARGREGGRLRVGQQGRGGEVEAEGANGGVGRGGDRGRGEVEDERGEGGRLWRAPSSARRWRTRWRSCPRPSI